MMRPLLLAACLALVAALPVAAVVTAQVPAPAPATPPAPSQPVPATATAAAPATPAALVGNPENGHTLSYTCQGCHGVTGYKNAYPNYHVPRIGGQSSAYLLSALSEYRNGSRSHPTMRAQAQSFSDQEIADLAAYLSTVKSTAK